MKGFIRGILITILFVLPIHGCAEKMLSINELVAQTDGFNWSQTYQAYERTIDVHIPAVIPKVEKLPIIQVSAWMGSEVVEKKGLLKASDQTNAGVGTLYEDEDIFLYLNNENTSDETATVYHSNPDEIDSATFTVFNKEPLAQLSGNWGFISECYYPYEIIPETVFAEDNSLSLADAENALKRILTYYYGEEAADVEMDYVEIRGRAREKNGRRWDDLGDYKKDYPTGTYCLHYRQEIKGIPIYMEIGNKMLTTNKTKISSDVASKWARISGMSEGNWFEFMDYTSFFLNAILLKEERILEADVPLASLDEVVGRLEEEINAGRIRDVFALRLGYVCYFDEGSPETYTLYPAWICDCIYTESAKESIMENVVTDAFRENFRYEQIIVDAQTCELQAGWIAEDEGLFHSAPITWDGV